MGVSVPQVLSVSMPQVLYFVIVASSAYLTNIVSTICSPIYIWFPHIESIALQCLLGLLFVYICPFFFENVSVVDLTGPISLVSFFSVYSPVALPFNLLKFLRSPKSFVLYMLLLFLLPFNPPLVSFVLFPLVPYSPCKRTPQVDDEKETRCMCAQMR